jgi:L-ascorbate metabolism protein UlaG (beta-lactamase superfamily)
MEITWYGLSCFRLVERGFATVITDPYDHRETSYARLNQTADIVTISKDAPAHYDLEAIKGAPYVIRGPGEYEVGGVFITGIQTGGQHASTPGRNTLYVFDYETLTIAHLGMLSSVPTQAEIEAFGAVNVALVPVGGGDNLNAARAAEVISMLEPKIVIPMHFATPKSSIPLEALGKFLKEMGLSDVNTQPALKVSRSTLPDETQVIVLDEQG